MRQSSFVLPCLLPQTGGGGGEGGAVHEVMSFTSIALAAYDGGRGRIRLATALLDYEKNTADKVREKTQTKPASQPANQPASHSIHPPAS